MRRLFVYACIVRVSHRFWSSLCTRTQVIFGTFLILDWCYYFHCHVHSLPTSWFFLLPDCLSYYAFFCTLYSCCHVRHLYLWIGVLVLLYLHFARNSLGHLQVPHSCYSACLCAMIVCGVDEKLCFCFVDKHCLCFLLYCHNVANNTLTHYTGP